MNRFWLWFAVVLHLGMFVWPVVLFVRADRESVRLGIVALSCALAASLWRFGATPPGVCCMDQAENMRLFYLEGRWAWLWLERRAYASQGFSFLPFYLANLWLGNFYGERIVGLICHLLLVLGGAALLPRRCLPAGLALLAVSPTVLWNSRHYDGTILLLPELGLIAALGALQRKESTGATIAAGVCLGYLSWCYMPARVTYLFPALWLWRRPTRALATYGVLAFCLTPLFLVPAYTNQPAEWRLLPGHVGIASYQIPSVRYAAQSFRSLVDPRAGATATTSYSGAQTLPWLSIPLIVAGSVKSPFGIAGLVGLAPDIFSSHEPAKSHRQFFSFLPFVFAAARGYPWLGGGPALAGGGAQALLGLAVAAEGLWRWVRLVTPVRSMIWRWPNGYSGLDPCNHVEPPPEWCPRSRWNSGTG